jgi:hypothetical protein
VSLWVLAILIKLLFFLTGATAMQEAFHFKVASTRFTCVYATIRFSLSQLATIRLSLCQLARGIDVES